MSIKAFFRDLFAEPESFFSSPYKYLLNQIGHVFFGATAPMYTIGATYYLSGIYPNQIPITINFLLAFFFGWELLKQGWRGLDTFLDTFFVGIGASFYIFVEMDIVLNRMLVLYTVIYVALFATTYRIWRQLKNKGLP